MKYHMSKVERLIVLLLLIMLWAFPVTLSLRIMSNINDMAANYKDEPNFRLWGKMQWERANGRPYKNETVNP